MEYIQFHCPSCHHLLVVPPEAAGVSGPCPNCQTLIQGPHPSPPPQPQPQPLNPPAPASPTVSLDNPPQAQADFASGPDPFVSSPEEAAIAAEPSPQYVEVREEPPLEEENPFEEELSESSEPDPTPEPAPSKKRVRKKRSGGLSFLQALLMSFLFSIAFFILGFFQGKSGSLSWQEILADMRKQEVEANNQPEPTPVEEQEIPIQELTPPVPPPVTDPLPSTTDTSDARASLEAFLACQSWSTRNAFVLYPDQVLSEMSTTAEKYGDAPIEAESITLEQETPGQKIFWIKTAENERPFSTILIEDEGRWLVDWVGFADFYYNRLDAFATGGEGPMSGFFRVFLKAAPGETAPLSPARCLVMAPQSTQSHQVNSSAESAARQKLADIFQAYLQSDEETFKEAMAGPGIPLIVELSRNGAANPALKMERIITTGWTPLPPKEILR